LPPLLHDTGRAPSWKSIAIAILKNDHHLHSLGFAKKETLNSAAIYANFVINQGPQKDMFR
jgi:predicted phosphoadenosine phosphosulfate sulfurtransferase